MYIEDRIKERALKAIKRDQNYMKISPSELIVWIDMSQKERSSYKDIAAMLAEELLETQELGDNSPALIAYRKISGEEW